MRIDTEELKRKLEPFVESLQFELAELTAPVVGGRQILRLFIFSPGGVSLDDCARVSRAVSDLLDTDDLIESRYTLEVSSLGLDRPLVTPRDFKRRVGEKVKVTYKDESGTKVASGILDEFDGNFIKIRTQKKTVDIPVNANPKGEIII